MEAVVFIILEIVFASRAVLKTGEYLSDIPQFLQRNIQSRDSLRPIACKRKH